MYLIIDIDRAWITNQWFEHKSQLNSFYDNYCTSDITQYSYKNNIKYNIRYIYENKIIGMYICGLF